MSILLRIDNHKAILRGAEWRCAHLPLEVALNRFTKQWVQREADVAELDGNLEDRIATEAAKRFDGRVGLRVSSEKRVNLREYQNLRQLDLFDGWGT